MNSKAGVLVVGPSNSFMWYIERVLPSLGETGVVMSSLATLYPGLRAVPEEDRAVAALKGDLRIVKVIKRAVADRQKVPAQVQRLNVEGTDVELTPEMVRSARSRARSTGKPHNEARETFVKILLKELTAKLDEQLNRAAGRVVERPYLQDDVRASLDVRRALNLAWMPLSPETLLRSLFSKPHYLESATRELSKAERALLARPADAPFTEADVPLLDEAAELLGTFYQATAFQPMGVRRRRHLMLEGRTVANIEDEVFDEAMLEDSEALHGEGALLAALNKKRTGRMGDIVATIQAEQDAIIRSDLPGVRVVQGLSLIHI